MSPAAAFPAGSCDSHVHVFGPPGLHPTAVDPAWDAPNAGVERLLAVHASLGIARGVLVQPSVYATDHRAMVRALGIAGPGYTGCITAKGVIEATDAELAALHAAGVRGGRFSRPGLASSVAADVIPRALARLAELGWYAKLQPDPRHFADMIAPFHETRVPLLIDHMGRPRLGDGEDDANLRATRHLLADRGAWLLLSLADRISVAGPPWDDVVTVASALIELAPGRVLWGSDWPHLGHQGAAPSDLALAELLARMAPDAALRQAILVDNPARLLGPARC
jgi:predicted TIM-barrel fold metal-dependent hydrolase